MVFFFRIAVVVFAKCVLAERNEAVKTALKMEDATKLLVDNLIAEMAQLRRENAEMTMKAEILAKEVKRLSPEARAPAPMVSEKVIQQHISDSLTQSKETDGAERRGPNCPSFTALQTTNKCIVQLMTQMTDVNQQVATGSSQMQCAPFTVTLDGMTGKMPNSCCGFSGRVTETTLKKSSAFNQRVGNCWSGGTASDTMTGYTTNPCATEHRNGLDCVKTR
mmetsp:Transcript_57706/g.114497  ORF Transcript_57706/g.114497 Transcript_57706/m.114497 type:complete len:221 (-) Transcript_57706:165-827(-)|eukprot:CAMPEP_0172655228 /NCGR_PEP_ID=MMETSP1074-20121228/501_1 /TAXON_ID=2916 /ORGANISM="Ceratium fusus, Strain PA161109" /LENGTH=220 /DNA_ID=CAMNT_0013469801 /DNA_START=52 /DNA_END=714 /DNA_ORIENTATION=-